MQAIQQGNISKAEQTLAQLQVDAGPRLKAVIPKLQAILAGERNPALAADSNLHFQDVAELHLLLETLGGNEG